MADELQEKAILHPLRLKEPGDLGVGETGVCRREKRCTHVMDRFLASLLHPRILLCLNTEQKQPISFTPSDLAHVRMTCRCDSICHEQYGAAQDVVRGKLTAQSWSKAWSLIKCSFPGRIRGFAASLCFLRSSRGSVPPNSPTHGTAIGLPPH